MSMKCSPTEVSGNYLLMEVVYRIKNTLACPNCDGFAEYCIGFGKSRNSDFYSVFWKSCVGNVGGVWVFADRNNESPVIPMERIEPQRHQLYNWFRTKSFTLLAHTNCEGYLKWGRAWNVRSIWTSLQGLQLNNCSYGCTVQTHLAQPLLSFGRFVSGNRGAFEVFYLFMCLPPGTVGLMSFLAASLKIMKCRDWEENSVHICSGHRDLVWTPWIQKCFWVFEGWRFKRRRLTWHLNLSFNFFLAGQFKNLKC